MLRIAIARAAFAVAPTAVAAAVMLTCAPDAAATLLTPLLPGATVGDGWEGLHNANYPAASGYGNGHPGTAAWTKTIAANAPGSAAGGTFAKASGAGYTASAGVYTGATGGTYRVSDPAALAGLQTVVFQTGMGGGTGDGDVAGEPLLYVNGSATGVAPLGSFVLGSEPANIGGFDVVIKSRLFQWDLTGQAVGAFYVEWTTVGHSQIYALRLDEGDTFAPVPEPGAIGGAAVAAAAVVPRRRRRA